MKYEREIWGEDSRKHERKQKMMGEGGIAEAKERVKRKGGDRKENEKESEPEGRAEREGRKKIVIVDTKEIPYSQK